MDSTPLIPIIFRGGKKRHTIVYSITGESAKQHFSPFTGDQNGALPQQTQQRLHSLEYPESPILIFNKDHRFIDFSVDVLGTATQEWEVKGLNKFGRRNTGELVVRIDPRYVGSCEVDVLRDDPS